MEEMQINELVVVSDTEDVEAIKKAIDKKRDEISGVIADKVIAYRTRVHTRRGTIIGGIGGALGLCGAFTIGSIILTIVGTVLFILGVLTVKYDSSLANFDLDGSENLHFYIEKLRKRNKEVDNLVINLEALSSIYKKMDSADDSVTILNDPEKAREMFTKVEPMKQPEPTYGDDKVRRRKKDR